MTDTTQWGADNTAASDALAHLRKRVALQIAIEGFRSSAAIMRETIARYCEHHVQNANGEPTTSSEVARNASFLAIEGTFQALARNATDLINHIGELVPGMPPTPPL
jgi:hypothetical protein